MSRKAVQRFCDNDIFKNKDLRWPDSRQFGNLGDKKVDEKTDTGNGRTLRNDQQAKRNRRRTIVAKHDLEPAVIQKIVDQPEVCRTNAASGGKGFARRKPVIDAQLSTDRDYQARAIGRGKNDPIAPRHIGHHDGFVA